MHHLRKYQTEAHDATFDAWKRHKSALLALTTSSGKTVIAAFIAKTLLEKPENRVLFIADRGELVDQPVKKFHQACGLFAGVERAAETASPNSRLVVGSLQTLSRRMPLGKPFTHIIQDEAHRDSVRNAKVHAMYPDAKILGLSGTPFRKNLADLSKWYEKVAYERSAVDMIQDGYVCPLEVQTFPLEVDMSAVGEKSGDYDPEDVANAMEPHYRAVAKLIKEQASNRTILAFLPLIQSSKDFVDVLASEGVEAVHADGTMSTEERQDIIQSFERGRYQVLSNSQLFSTGVDFIRCDCLLNLSITKSRGEFRQRVGRIMRLLPGTIDPDGHEFETAPERRTAIAASKKPSALILDLLYQVPKHGIAGPACMFAESAEEEDEFAKRIRIQRDPKDMEQISREIQADRETKLRVALSAQALSTGLIDANAYGVLIHDKRLIDYVPVNRADQMPVTDEQKKFLTWARVDPASVNGTGHAKMILAIARERKEKGLLPVFSLFRLKSDGVEGAESMTQQDAETVSGEALWGIGKSAGTPIRLMPERSKKWWRETFFAEKPHFAKKYPREAAWCGFEEPKQEWIPY